MNGNILILIGNFQGLAVSFSNKSSFCRGSAPVPSSSTILYVFQR